MKILIVSIAALGMFGCQLMGSKSQLKASNNTSEEKALADTITLGLSYPYERESGSYLFVNGTPYLYDSVGRDPLVDGTLRVDGKSIQVDTLLNNLAKNKPELKPAVLSKRTPVIAYGSNAAVSALKRKFMSEKFARGWAIIPVLKGSMKNFEVVHAAHFVPVNGSFPAGFAYNAGAESEVWITFLDSEEMERMHASEGIDSDSPESWYSYGRLDGIKIQIPGWRELTSAFVYIDNYGALQIDGKSAALAKVPGKTLSPKVAMTQALASVDAIFKKFPASEEAAKNCAKWTGVEKMLCENISDACVRDDRTQALEDEKRVVYWSLPATSGVTYTRLAGSDKAGHPKAFPDSMRCARIPKPQEK
ncbi:MAG: hypothetical protein RI953_1778 [Pseudomonadota bacterium]|jgi:hypothetical protein